MNQASVQSPRSHGVTSPSATHIEADRILCTEHLQTDLVSRTARGAAVTLAAQAVKFFASLVGTAVLARLLTPNDYGLIGMVAVVIGFVAMFKDLGLSAASVQRTNLTNTQVSTLFWINVA